MLSLFKGRSIGYRSVSGIEILLRCMLHPIGRVVYLRVLDKFLSTTGILGKNLRATNFLRSDFRRTGS